MGHVAIYLCWWCSQRWMMTYFWINQTSSANLWDPTLLRRRHIHLNYFSAARIRCCTIPTSPSKIRNHNMRICGLSSSQFFRFQSWWYISVIACDWLWYFRYLRAKDASGLSISMMYERMSRTSCIQISSQWYTHWTCTKKIITQRFQSWFKEYTLTLTYFLKMTYHLHSTIQH